jgi:hypothetical protein
MKTNKYLWWDLAQFCLEWEMVHTKVAQEIKTHVLSESRAVYEIIWENTVERARSQMAIWRMRIACWIIKATSTHSKYVNSYCFSTTTMAAPTRLNITSYVQYSLSVCLFQYSARCITHVQTNITTAPLSVEIWTYATNQSILLTEQTFISKLRTVDSADRTPREADVLPLTTATPCYLWGKRNPYYTFIAIWGKHMQARLWIRH